jgi:hypothetical protein
MADRSEVKVNPSPAALWMTSLGPVTVHVVAPDRIAEKAW